MSYGIGDTIDLRCTSAPSKPAAKLRWFLNDHELFIPSNDSSLATGSRNHPISTSAEHRATLSAKHNKENVKVSPIEYRQHYKGIYSSHSSLRLVLQEDDLINKKIGFKCLASMRQEVPVNSKQLIVLTPPSQSLSNRIRRAKREQEQMRFVEAENSDLDSATPRSKHNRHRVSRLQNPTSKPKTMPKNPFPSDMLSNQAEEYRHKTLYVYEDSDSTLGPSIIDRPDTLEEYLRSITNFSSTVSRGNNYVLDFNKADNAEYIQSIRDRIARQRSLPSTQAGSSIGTNHKKLHGINTLVKSPLVLDENDPLRPIISWPPLSSGALILLSPGDTIVAIPTQSGESRQNSEDTRFISPKSDSTVGDTKTFRSKGESQSEAEARFIPIVIEHLMQNMNCVCADGSIDSKLGWILNDNPINMRDTRFYPTRTSPDHRQTSLTIGFQMPKSNYQSSSLRTILSRYRISDTQIPSKLTESLGPAHTTATDSRHGNHIRFICQAVHSLLLYSSSEMITFDFNIVTPLDNNSIDRFTSLSNNNVIQSASGEL